MKQFFIADDLSGALDAAAAFHHAGRRVCVTWDLHAADAAGPTDVVAFTTETRNLAPAAAADVVRAILEHAQRRGARLLYKKIDSTLRGPVAAELEAVLRVWPEMRILLCPANPAVGRTVRDGLLLVRGVPVAETEFGRDPVSPVVMSSVRQLVRDVSDHVVVADASTDADLAYAVKEMAAGKAEWVGVGSGALARPVAKWLFPSSGAVTCATPRLPATAGLVVCGSAHPANREQAAVLRAERGIPLHEMKLADPEAVNAAVRESLAANGGAAIAVERGRMRSADCLAAISRVAASVIRSAGVRRIFAMGGETTFALCRELGITSLQFGREVEPGLSMSFGRALDGTFAFAVKPGGFGDAGTWTRAWDHLAKV